MAEQVGSAYIPLRPDLRNFHKLIRADLEAQLKPIADALGKQFGKDFGGAVRDSIGDPFEEPVHNAPRDGDKAAGAFANAFKARIRAALKSLPDVELGADATAAEKKIAELRGELSALSDKKIGVDLTADDAITALEGLRAEYQAIDKSTLTIDAKANVTQAIAALDAFKADVDRLNGTTAAPTVEIKLDPAGQARLTQVRASLDEIGARIAEARVNADTSEAQAKLAQLQATLIAIGERTERPDISLGGVAQAEAQLLALGVQLDRIDGRHVDVDASRATSSLAAFGSTAASALPAVGSLASGASSAAGSMGMFGAEALIAVPAVVALGGATAALAATMVGPLTAAVAGFGGLAAVAVPSIMRVKQALDAQKQAQDRAGVSAVQNQQRAVSMATAEAQVAQAVRNAALQHSQALDQVRQAEQSLAQQQQSAKQAQEALNAAREQAVRDAQDLTNNLADARLGQRQDTINVTQAEQELQKVLSDPTATELQRKQARLNYDQAIQALKEQRLLVKRLAQDKARSDRDGINGDKNVISARRALQAANIQVANSERTLAKARADVGRTDQQSAQQIAAARRSATAAALSQASANAQLSKSTVALTGPERQLAAAWTAFSSAFQSWQRSLQPTVLPLFARGLHALTGVFPLLTPAITTTASAVDGLITSFQHAMASPFWVGFSKTLGTLAGQTTTALGTALGSIATGVAGIIQAFAPFAPIVLGGITHAAAAFATFGQGLTQYQPVIKQVLSGLSGIFAGLAPVFHALVSAIGQIIGPVTQALAQVARAIGATLAPVIRALAPVVAQLFTVLAPVITALAAGLKPVLMALVPIIQVVVGAIGAVARALTPVLPIIGQIAATLIGAFATALRSILTAIAPLLPPLASLIAQLASALLPVLTPIITLLGQVAGQILGALLGAIIQVLPSIIQIVQAIGKLLLLLTPLIPTLVQLALAFIPLIPPVVQLVAELLTGLMPVLTWLLRMWVNQQQFILSLLIPAVKFLVTSFVRVVNFINKVLGPVFTWLYTKVIRPVWNAIGSIIRWVWNNVIKPVLNLLHWWFHNVIGPVFSWIYNRVIKPIWNAVGTVVRAVWDHVIKPAFNALKTGVGLVHKAFTNAVDGIKRIWATLKAAAQSPIKFIVNTVYSGHLRPMVNGLLTKLGLGKWKLPNFKYAAGTASILPGYTPGRDVHTFFSPTAGRLNLSGGEGIARPEVVQAMGASRFNGLNAAARSGGVTGVRREMGFASGGIYPGGHSYAGGGTVDWLTGKVGGLWDTITGTAGNVLRKIKDTAFAAGRALFDKVYKLSGIEGWVNHLKDSGAFQGISGGALELAVKAIRSFLDTHAGASGQAADVIRVANSYIGTHEQPMGSNNTIFGRKFGLNGAPWCAIFVDEVFKEAGAKGAVPWSAAVSDFNGSHLKRRHGAPVPGDLLTYGNDHINIYTGPGRRSVGGNQSNAVTADTSHFARHTGTLIPNYARGNPGGGIGLGSKGGYYAYAKDFMRQMGMSVPYNWSSLFHLWQGESNWNPHAVNRASGAGGIPQALPASKMSAGWYNHPGQQIGWGLRYIRDRYDNPVNAYRAWQARSPHWYDSGGWLEPGLTTVYNGTRKPEAVLTGNQWDAIEGRVIGGDGAQQVYNYNAAGPDPEFKAFIHELDMHGRRARLGGLHG